MIETMFTVNFFHKTLNAKVDPLLISELSTEVTGETYNIDDGGSSSHPSNVLYQTDARLESLVDEIKISTQEAWNELEFREDLSPIITEMWMNVVYPKGKMTDQAHHSKYSMYGVYYLQADENCGDLVLHHPLDGMTRNLPYQPKPNLDRYKIKPKTGELIIFPSSFVFNTKENKSESNRITLEFGINYKLKV
jgi:uncharacterized protein (TIGR02466 family)